MKATNTDPLSSKEESLLYEAALLEYRNSQSLKTPNDTDRLCKQFAARVNLMCAAHSNPLFRERTALDLEEESEQYAQLMESVFASSNRQEQPRGKLAPVHVDVDAFFDAYPECMRRDISDDSSEEETDKEMSEIKEPKRIALDNHHPQAVFPSSNNNSNNKTKPTNNPYASRQNIEDKRSMIPAVHPIDPPSTYDQRPGSWEDHTNAHNPFQTAKEYSFVADQQGKRPSDNHPTPREHTVNNTRTNPYLPHNNVQNNSWDANPYAQTTVPQGGYNPYQQNSEGVAPPPPPMEIRDSLKRKFVPPVKRGLAKSSGRDGAAAAKTSKENKQDSESEDDLPEELKRFGKELVEKIESEIMDSGDPVTFDDIAGLLDAKQTVQEVVCWPMKRPDLFTGLRRAPNGLLLYGPPGTGKTLIGKAIAHESGATFFSISSSSLTSKWIGEGEKLVRTLFAVAGVREPSVVFIDEIDSLLTQRKSDENEASRRIKTEFLVQLDGTGTSGQGRVLIIGATNRPQELDEAARRRFTKRLYIPLPNEDDRERLIRVLLENNKHNLVDSEIVKLAKDTSGFSGADLKALSTDAAMGPIRQLGSRALDVDINDIPPIAFKHFRQALRGMKPSVAPSDLIQYEEWDKTYGSNRSHGTDAEDCGSDEESPA